jgi:hypothetical protein
MAGNGQAAGPVNGTVMVTVRPQALDRPRGTPVRMPWGTLLCDGGVTVGYPILRAPGARMGR